MWQQAGTDFLCCAILVIICRHQGSTSKVILRPITTACLSPPPPPPVSQRVHRLEELGRGSTYRQLLRREFCFGNLACPRLITRTQSFLELGPLPQVLLSGSRFCSRCLLGLLGLMLRHCVFI